MKNWSLVELQLDLKRLIWEHRASASLPKFTNQDSQVPLLLFQSTITQQTWKYIDYHLQPVLKLASYMKGKKISKIK